jgi:hypothetical protein
MRKYYTEEYCLLGFDTMWTGRSKLCMLLGLLFNTEDGSIDLGKLLQGYKI